MPPLSINRSKRPRFPAEMISHGVWLYGRVCLSDRAVAARLCARGIIVTYEAIRTWCRQFGQHYAHQWRHRRPSPGATWHLEAVVLTMHGQHHS